MRVMKRGFTVRLLITVFAAISTLLIGRRFSEIFSAPEAGSITNRFLQSQSTNDREVLEPVEIDSDAYYALPRVRETLIEAVRKSNEELQEALSNAGEEFSEPKSTLRAVMGYLPPKQDKFISELKWFYLSVGHMRTFQRVGTKTDLIIFTEPSNVEFVRTEFKCKTELRESSDEPEACIVLAHVPLKAREVPSGSPKPPLVEYANYIDSMLILAEFPISSKYDMLLRTDLDTFLTPGFADWSLPPPAVIATGRGGYGSENANRHLSWVMKSKLNLKDGGMIGLGSTWYGKAPVMISAAKLTVSAMNWLHTQEFNEYEQSHAGTDGWPYWHWPVLLLYGGHVALNQIPATHIMQNTDGQMELDSPTANKALMTDATKHLHCYHGTEFFSKFKFYAGEYKAEDITKYDAMNTTQSYSSVIAISSGRLANRELADLIGDAESMASRKWKRMVPTLL